MKHIFSVCPDFKDGGYSKEGLLSIDCTWCLEYLVKNWPRDVLNSRYKLRLKELKYNKSFEEILK